jgi:hypothetical protein
MRAYVLNDFEIQLPSLGTESVDALLTVFDDNTEELIIYQSGSSTEIDEDFEDAEIDALRDALFSTRPAIGE